MSISFRLLTAGEISQLENQGCRCDNWSQVKVSESFSPFYIHQTFFSGEIVLNSFSITHTLQGGMPQHSGIYRASLHNCIVEDDVLIMNNTGFISNYHIHEGAQLIGVDQLSVSGKSSFGNGVKALVLNETGGRDVTLYNGLSSQIAYILAMYRHNPNLIASLEGLIKKRVDDSTHKYGVVGKRAKLHYCGIISDVNIGDYAKLKKVTSLDNGTVNSSELAPTRVTNAVVAKDFVFATGAIVGDGAHLTRCYVGQASHIGHQFSAHDSLFFANSQMENGEACAVFAGPYSVSMHKSTLLIASMCSFMNAGSGSNQSNHMYKLGPIHQGIVERGGRLASDSYIMWPAKLGAFTMVMGRHYSNFDTSIFPFSYLIAVGNDSLLMPGANLAKVGTMRDSQKWPKRDNRNDLCLDDRLSFNILNPYTIGNVVDGLNKLLEIRDNYEMSEDTYFYDGFKIKASSLNKGISYYREALNSYFGSLLAKKLMQFTGKTFTDLQSFLYESDGRGLGPWVDLSGMLAPKAELDKLLLQVEGNSFSTIAQFEDAISDIHNNYSVYEWNWAKYNMASVMSLDLNHCYIDSLKVMLDEWIASEERLTKELLLDARKEFDKEAQVGFGIDDQDERVNDFENVRGKYEEQDFIKKINSHLKEKKALLATVLHKIEGLK